jgi:hypothetical protein
VLIVPVAAAGGIGGSMEAGNSEIVRLADIGSVEPGQAAPQLFATGQPMYRFTGALNVPGEPDGTTTVEVTALAMTIVFRQAVCETTQAELPLPAHAEVDGRSDATNKQMAMSKSPTAILRFFILTSFGGFLPKLLLRVMRQRIRYQAVIEEVMPETLEG